MVWILLLSDMDLSTHALTANNHFQAFGVCQDLIGGEALASNQSLYLTTVITEAAPKCISGSTSYLQVWLAFHPYPQVIQRLFNANWFGPPLRVTVTSSCSRVDHLVSRLLPLTLCALLRLAFASAATLKVLTSLVTVTRRFIMQKARRHST